jgi:hypothetical protein
MCFITSASQRSGAEVGINLIVGDVVLPNLGVELHVSLAYVIGESTSDIAPESIAVRRRQNRVCRK